MEEGDGAQKVPIEVWEYVALHGERDPVQVTMVIDFKRDQIREEIGSEERFLMTIPLA